ncbi:L-aspartate oxidase, partial [Klebsiella pneumoniae]|nr:L-aspartate oxidase [Klebsiella pneumoniae]
NSLLECFVYGMSAARHIAAAFAENRVPPIPTIPDWDSQDVTDPDEEVIVLQNWDELRQSMWHYVGIVRSDKRLHRALNRILLLKQEVND